MDDRFSFSRRTSWESSLNEITRIREELQRSGTLIYDLTESNPTRCGFDSFNHRLLAAFQNDHNLVYEPDPRGIRESREQISTYYRTLGISVDPEHIFLTAGTSEGYSFLFRLLADPGEKVLLPRPSYPLFQFLADLNDVAVDFYPLVCQDRWTIDFVALERIVDSMTKALILVNPNNPTGQYLTRVENQQLQQMCWSRGVALVSDEVFYDYELNKPSNAVSLTAESSGLNFTLGGISKMLGLPQMKLSWIVVSGSKLLVEEACRRLEIIADTYLSVNTPVQRALKEWTPLRKEIQADITTRLKRNLKALINASAAFPGVRVLPSEGGWYAVLELPRNCAEERLVTDLLEKDHVFAHPGYFFDFVEGNWVVLSLLPEENVFHEGVRRLFARIAAC